MVTGDAQLLDVMVHEVLLNRLAKAEACLEKVWLGELTVST